jgi:hypothetical protein
MESTMSENQPAACYKCGECDEIHQHYEIGRRLLPASRIARLAAPWMRRL